MDTEHTDILIQELVTLDPSLNEHAAELRVLVREILAKRPIVTIDEAFRTSLRARLLTERPQVMPSPYAQLSWWALRLVPLGAVALLLITLVPGDILEAPSSVDETFVATEIADMKERDTRILDARTGDAPRMMTEGMGGGGPSGIDTNTTIMSMKALPTALPFTIPPQRPGPTATVESVTVTEASFIVISTYRTDGQEMIVGVSPLIREGTTTDVPIYLRTPTHVGEYYVATLYTDNGNRVFTYGEDVPFYDAYGTPASIGFDIISGYFE